MSSLTVEEDQKWVPTHVQVTVLRGRGLRGKGKHGTSDVYTIIQVGKEKYSTGVAEKTTEPEWKEECSFELQPGVLESDGRCSYPSGSSELVLTVMHRALIGLDVFLGQAVIQLDKIFRETRCVKNEWYRLNSKTGKKEKERGDIQVTVQFTRNNLTASMYDLVMKDKTASTFGKLKERMKGKRRSSEEDSSSAVLPGGYGSLYRMRQRLPSDGGGEEDYEDDEGGEVRRSKMRTFFLRGKLRKSSDTRSSTSLGSESSESSSRGGSLSPTAGISVVVSDLSNSPSNSSNLTVDNSPEHTADTSPKLSPLKSEYGDEVGEITIPVPQPPVYVNGSHANSVQPLDPGSGKPVDPFGLLQKSLPLSVSLQNLSPHTSTITALPKGPAGDGRRWSFDKPDEEEKAAIAAALEKSGPMLSEEEERSEQAAPHKDVSSSSSLSTAELEGKKQRRNLFSSHGRSESAGRGQSKDGSEHAAAAAVTEEKHRGWFGSKEAHSKPSLVMSPKLDPPPPPLPPGPSVDPTPLVSPLHHTNPFCCSQPTSPPMSPCNPFFPLAQQNPFYEDMLTSTPLNPPLPPLPYLSSSRPPISQLFPHSRKETRPLPPVPTEEEKPFSKKSANPFTELDSEWDESFEAFAAGRLQSPEDPATDCKTQRNTPGDHPPERCSDEGAPFFMSGADQNTNVNETLLHHHQTCTDFTFKPSTNTHHFDTFAQFLETIPEHTSFESENTTLTLTNHTNFTDTVDANLHQNSSTKLNSASPDPVSSGLGSSTEEDFLSCLSSYSDKFSASSSEETEAQNFEGNLFSFEKHKRSHPSEAEDDFTDRSGDLSLDELEQRTVIQEDSGNEMEEDTRVPNLAEHQNQATKLIPMSDVVKFDETMDGNPSEGGDVASKPSVSQGSGGFDVSLEDFTPGSLSDPHPPTPPSLHIITSSPDQSKASPESRDTRFELLSTSAITSSPSQGIDDTLLRSSLSDKSNSSFSQSFYVSADSQPYQTCASESNEMLTIIGEQSGSETTSDASCQQVESSKTSVEGNYVKDGLKESVNGTLTKGSDFGLETLGVSSDLSVEVSSRVSDNKITPIQSKGDSLDILSDAITDANPGLESEGNQTPAFDEKLPLSLSGASNGSFQTIYVSADSLPNQTGVSETNETPTIIAEQSGSETTSDTSCQQGDPSKTSAEQICVKDELRESIIVALTNVSDTGLVASNSNTSDDPRKFDVSSHLDETQRPKGDGLDSLPQENETLTGQSGGQTTSDASCQRGDSSETPGEGIYFMDGLGESIRGTSSLEKFPQASNSNKSNNLRRLDASSEWSVYQSYEVSVGVSDDRIDPETSQKDQVQRPKGDKLDVLPEENGTLIKQSGGETTSDAFCRRGDPSKTPGEGIYFMDGLEESMNRTSKEGSDSAEASSSNARNDVRQLDVSTDLSTKQSYEVSVGVTNNRIDPERSQKDQVQRPKDDGLAVLPEENWTLIKQSGGQTTSDAFCRRGDPSKTSGGEINFTDGLGESITHTSTKGRDLAEASNSNTSNNLRQLDASSEWSVYQSYEVSVGVLNNRIDPEKSQKDQVQRPKGDDLEVISIKNETQTIVSEGSGSKTTSDASCQQSDSRKTPGEGICLKDGLGESIDGTLTRVWNNSTNSGMDPNNGFDFLPEELTDANPGLESQDAILAPPLQRSHSEGALTPAFDDLLLPSFGSDPGAIQESSPSPPTPDPPSLTPFPSSLTSDRSSPPVALSPLPLFHGVARAAAPTPKPAGANQDAAENSPHPVKPLNTATPAEEKRTEGRSVLEKLKSTIHPGRSSQVSEQETERKKSLTEGAGSYYHLNHSELVALLVQREAELQRQKAEFERQKVLLAKREVELKKLKPQVKDLEDYIDTLLVRIMEQKPTLLQVRSKLK